jgi:hypothetical protein
MEFSGNHIQTDCENIEKNKNKLINKQSKKPSNMQRRAIILRVPQLTI